MHIIRFLHIPKTAGTTFTRILLNQYGCEKYFQFTGDIIADRKRFGLFSRKEKDEIKLYSGHAPINTGLQYVDGLSTITFLRNPIDRVKSFCQHVSEGKSDYLRKRFPPDRFNLDQFLKAGILELSNLQTKMLVNTGRSAINFSMPIQQVLELANEHLFNRLSAFGLVEYFDESLMLFKSQFDWNMPYYCSSNIKNKDKLIQFNESHIESIKELNQLDIKLYELAHAKFIQKINDPSFDRMELRDFQKKNSQLEIKKTNQKLKQFKNKLYAKLFGR